jgi:hypothetical protein
MRLRLLALCALCLAAGAGCDDTHSAQAAQLPSAKPPTSAVHNTLPPLPPKPSRRLVPAKYPADRVQSPITEFVAHSLRRIAARNPDLHDDRFIKIGDSITVSGNFLYCFSGDHVDLGKYAALEKTLLHFHAGADAGLDPFARRSHAAGVGWSAFQALDGKPPVMIAEENALNARFAVVMFGTNDMEMGKPRRFSRDLADIVDRLVKRGVVPILSTIPPRGDRHDRNALVPEYDAAIRHLAEARQIPLVDYHHALMAAPHHGLGHDGIHPSVYKGPLGRSPCDFSGKGLGYGFNLRNMLTLQALDRSWRALHTGKALDPG